MRTFPAGWPDADDLVQTPPTLYIHLVGSGWPAAVGDLPAGYAEVGSWNIDADLKGSLLPGQVANPSGFAIASGHVTIPQPEAGRIAPWKTGDLRAAIPDGAELIASYDGPLGATAVLLGTFRVDPVSSKASEPSLSIELVEDWVELRRPHTVTQVRFGTTGGGKPIPWYDPQNYPYDPSLVIEQIADDAGFAHDVPSFGTEITSIYFPGDMDAMSAIQQIVAAHLGAVRVTANGTISVLSYDDLTGGVAPTETLLVLDEFEDLEWVLDPAEVYDRVEVTFIPPEYVSADMLSGYEVADQSAFMRGFAIWAAGEKAHMAAGASRDIVVDPGGAWSASAAEVGAYSKSDGTGTYTPVLDVLYTEVGSFSEVSTGRVLATFRNEAASRRYLVSQDGDPTYLFTDWKDTAGADDAVLLAWGADAYSARNPLSVDLGRMIQRRDDAVVILNRIVAQVKQARPFLPNVNVVPDLRRELGDTVWVDFPEEGLHGKAAITAIRNSGEPGQLRQQLGLVFLAPRIRDFNDAWDATVSPTIADFNTRWSGLTIADFNTTPLDT